MDDPASSGLQHNHDVNRSQFFLDSAEDARKDGNLRLAIHLYCAAFELAVDNGQSPDERTLFGLRQAWLLACEQGDRSTAEAIFNDLAPYNSADQTQEALEQLQGLAIEQLEDLGLQKEDIEDMALALVDELEDAGIDIDAIADNLINPAPADIPKFDLNALTSRMALRSFPGFKANQPEPEDQKDQELSKAEHQIRYSNLYGFEAAKAKMRAFGLVDPSDSKMLGFLEQAESFHGISGPVLSKTFLFSGSSREDTGIFATATAAEIGWPVVNMIIDINEAGDGTIKVMAPIRRSFFGPPRIPELPDPCTLVIQNIDILQDLFWREEQSMNQNGNHYGHRANDGTGPHGSPGRPSGYNPGPGGNWHSLKAEIMGYLSSLRARGGIFIVATTGASVSEEPLILGEDLEFLIGPFREISLENPNRAERKKVLEYFSKEHPSFHDLDLFKLAQLSKGMGRYEIVLACRKAVENAYSESLKNQHHQMVSLEDVLTQFIGFISHESVTYRQIEDFMVEQFKDNLNFELLTFDYDTIPVTYKKDAGNVSENPDNNQAGHLPKE